MVMTVRQLLRATRRDWYEIPLIENPAGPPSVVSSRRALALGEKSNAIIVQ
jgi:hypothetical protein